MGDEPQGYRGGPIAATCLAADTRRMARKPKQPLPTRWDVFKIAKKAVWLGSVEAPDKSAAVEKAAQEFKTEAWRLYAVPRR
jgi:hypothetical protein